MALGCPIARQRYLQRVPDKTCLELSGILKLGGQSANLESFKAQNAEICTSRLKTPKSVLPPPPAQEHDFRDFHGSKRRNLYSPAPVPPSSLDPREARALAPVKYDFAKLKCRNLSPPHPGPNTGKSTIFETFKAQSATVLPRTRAPRALDPRKARAGGGAYDFRTVPPAAWTPERPEHGRERVRFSRLSTLKMPKSVPLYSPAPVAPSSLGQTNKLSLKLKGMLLPEKTLELCSTQFLVWQTTTAGSHFVEHNMNAREGNQLVGEWPADLTAVLNHPQIRVKRHLARNTAAHEGDGRVGLLVGQRKWLTPSRSRTPDALHDGLMRRELHLTCSHISLELTSGQVGCVDTA